MSFNWCWLERTRSWPNATASNCLVWRNKTIQSMPRAVRAIYNWRAGNAAESVEMLYRFYTLLRESPWIIPFVSEAAVFRTTDIAKAHPELALCLYRLLSYRYALNRFNYDPANHARQSRSRD